jgi:cell division protein FtsL
MSSKKVLIIALVVSSILYILSYKVREDSRQFQKNIDEINSNIDKLKKINNQDISRIHDKGHIYFNKCYDTSYHLKSK